MDLLIIAPISGLVALGVAGYLYWHVRRQDPGSGRMIEISDAIREGAMAYLKREYLTLAVFVLVVAVVLAAFLGVDRALAYAFGSACSALAGFFGMDMAVRANVRVAQAARKGMTKAFSIGFYSGCVMGMSVVGMALLGISALYYVSGDLDVILAFSFGASSLALFAKAGGGIFTKTADISADLVGKVEKGIPEDDPRNPAVIADNVGDNVGDVAGMGADLIDSYIAAIIASMIIGLGKHGLAGATLPVMLAAVGIFASVLGIPFVRVGEGADPGTALNRGTFLTMFIFAALVLVLVRFLKFDMGIFYATVAGLGAGIMIGLTSDYFTSIERGPVKRIAQESLMGASTNILTGFSYGLVSAAPPIIGICAATILSYHFAGMYGVAISAVGMLAIVGMIVSNDAFGPITDNAKGISEQAGLGEEVIAVGDRLDAAGNTVKAITKGFAIGGAALTVLALFGSYAEIVGIEALDLMHPNVVSGVFIGAMMPPFLSALLILAVGKNAYKMIDEVRRQFREIPGIMEGKTRPDYTRVVDMGTKDALRGLVAPSVLSMVVPPVVGLVLGKEALGGFLGGSIFTGMIFAIFMANSGGAWDNAKKYIEAGAFGGKGSEPHKAAVIGDTVGDPFKDTAGPSLNTLICVMGLSASVFAPLIAAYALFG